MNEDTTLTPQGEEEQRRSRVEQTVFEGLGELSSLFMQQEVLATQIVMPSAEARQIGERIMAAFDEYAKVKLIEEITNADARLKDEFGEDWLAFRDARLKELRENGTAVRTVS